METMIRFSYYDILELSPHCAQNEITTAYDRLRSTYSGENPAIYSIFSENEAREYLHLVEEAYSVLGNKTLRALYDEKVGQGLKSKDSISFDVLQAESKTVFNEVPKKISTIKIKHLVDPKIEDEIKTRTDWDGEFLRKVRDYKGVSLEKMSEVTKISGFYITAIETMEHQNLPAVVFVRGYVGQIAKTLGLNEKAVCDSYMKTFRQKLGTA
ncbi:MAG: helix-turn-helix domain-containing protein [Bdellovibrio sp.]|jgi:curved DNA-binding protein CbpA